MENPGDTPAAQAKKNQDSPPLSPSKKDGKKKDDLDDSDLSSPPAKTGKKKNGQESSQAEMGTPPAHRPKRKGKNTPPASDRKLRKRTKDNKAVTKKLNEELMESGQYAGIFDSDDDEYQLHTQDEDEGSPSPKSTRSSKRQKKQQRK